MEELPSTVNVDGNSYDIKTDYITWIKFENIVRDKTKKDNDKFIDILLLVYERDKIPRNISAAFQAAVDFYTNGKIPINETQDKNKPRVLDYEYDSGYIYSALLSQYKIDLTSTRDIHWYKFNYMIAGLNDDIELVKIMGYRSVDLGKIKNKEEKKRLQKLKNRYALPSDSTGLSVEKQLINAFKAMF